MSKLATGHVHFLSKFSQEHLEMGIVPCQVGSDDVWLVVEPTPLRNMSSSVGIMTFPIYGKNMFQTTNQLYNIYKIKHMYRCK